MTRDAYLRLLHSRALAWSRGQRWDRLRWRYLRCKCRYTADYEETRPVTAEALRAEGHKPPCVRATLASFQKAQETAEKAGALALERALAGDGREALALASQAGWSERACNDIEPEGSAGIAGAWDAFAVLLVAALLGRRTHVEQALDVEAWALEIITAEEERARQQRDAEGAHRPWDAIAEERPEVPPGQLLLPGLGA